MTASSPSGNETHARSGLRVPHRRGRGLKAVALGVVAALALAACGTRPSESAAAGDTSKPIVVGISLPLTGDFAQPGSEAKRGYEVWRDMVNAKGGVLGRKVELKITDDASNQDTVVADYTKLITQDKVDLLLGTFSSLLNYAASAVAEKNGMVFVEPAGGAPNMFERNFKYLFFAQQATAPHQADVFVDWIKSLPEADRPKTAAYPTQDDPFAKPVIESMQKQLEALGVQTVYSEVYPADATNFQTIASNLAAKKPDLVAQGAVFEDGVGLVRSLKQLNFSPKVLFQTSAPSNAGQYSDAVGLDNTEGVFYTVSWNEKATTPLNADFVAAYKKAYNADPAEDAADAFASAQVLQTATEKVGSIDQDKIRDWLHANTVDTILGPLSWEATGEPKGQFLLAQWQSGKVEVVAPSDVATSTTVVNPKPAWK
ncbi:amino acid ABC transporter substrate-binding protein [Planotetraspora phitsanulokensis]|uniref:Branched-chain amino acid ABC transporter substrate-binding protein n=1 Tax=Planotetraspora phitsanulokensis TaxID=575192 RepID=A0A8J3XDZ9_9ACTN|nr:amino acid ABC transporter substrate-binding protein [Planotetraspora phitsanulokensis]GII37565.1 branched-chain amino acid ABC transporter substrate-binding protein [Planotetraspora phitsanulokensis]